MAQALRGFPHLPTVPDETETLTQWFRKTMILVLFVQVAFFGSVYVTHLWNIYWTFPQTIQIYSSSVSLSEAGSRC